MKDSTLGFIGLGNMGEPMAHNLLAAGFGLKVFNRTRARAESLARKGAAVVALAKDVVASGGMVVTMLANDAALEAVTLGDAGFAQSLGPGGVHLSMSTISPELSRRLAKIHAEHGSHYVSAPVFGRPEAAAAKKLWICVSGKAQAKALVAPILDALGQGSFDFGNDPGAANVVKLAGNFMILSAIETLGEALAFGEKNGIGRRDLGAFFGQTIFACPIYQNYGRIVAERAYQPAGFRLELGMKDVRLVRDTAESARVPMPIADLLHARLLSALAKGRADYDWTAVELAIAEDSGITLAS